MANCDFVGGLFIQEHKVSGPVFEAIALGKPVMVVKNAFGRYIKSLFPTKTFFVGEPMPLVDNQPNIDIYNKSIINSINQNK